MSELEDILLLLIRETGLPEPVRQHKFSDTRRFKLDFAWPDQKLGVEVNGGTWIKSGHTTGGGLDRDYEKNNLCQLGGWRLLIFNKRMIEDGTAIETIKKAIGEYLCTAKLRLSEI
jgi:very-short-patch-repair endonuclease